MNDAEKSYLWSWINATANTTANTVSWQPTSSAYIQPTYVLPDGWVPTDPAIPVPVDTPPQKEGELVSLNVAPVTGKTPKQIAIELRALLKQMLQTAGPTPQVALSQVNTAASHWKSADASIGAEQKLLDAIAGDLEEISKIASLRKPSLIRGKKKEIEKKLELLKREAERERHRRTRAYNYMVSATDKMTKPGGSDLATLQRIYALVQGLPATEGAPQGKLESTIRAIEAILKAHHGVDVLGGFDKVPVPEGLPLVMVHYMTPPEVIAEPAEQSPGAENGSGVPIVEEPVAPGPVTFSFLSASGSAIGQTLVQEAVNYYWMKWGYINPEDKTYLMGKYGGTILGANSLWTLWNGGSCSLEVAFDVLRCVRGAYSDATITLKSSPDEVIHYVAAAGLFVVQPEELITL